MLEGSDLMTVLSVQERVAKGVAWLDSQQPDWRDRVNVQTLDIMMPANCVLGQVFKGRHPENMVGYFYAEEYLGMSFPYEYGFDAKGLGSEMRQDYADLKAEWIRVLSDEASEDE